MATYHLTSKPISRSAGRSATGAAAYRAGEEITDARTGQVHDYTRKAGVLHTELVLPGGGGAERAEFWNAIELHHKRGDAVLVREIEVSLPTELTPAQRQALAVGFASTLAEHYGVAADVALHAPRTVTDKELDKRPGQYFEIDPATGRRHNGNWHAHILLSACHVLPSGELGKKAVELDPIHCQRAKIPNLAERERERWAALTNAALEQAGHSQRIDHRSHAERGREEVPGIHLGPAAAGFERRTGEKSAKRQDWELASAERLSHAKMVGDQLRAAQLERSILDLTGDLAAARAERARQQQAAQIDAQTAAREYARQAAAQFKAEQAARDFGRQAATQLKQDLAGPAPGEPGREPAPGKVRQHVIAHTLPGAEVKPLPEIEREGPKKARDRGGPGHSR